MKASLATGLATERSYTVDETRVIAFMGDECRVYATPSIIRDVEATCRNFLLEHLDAGEDSVGTRVNIEHVGPALLGAQVTVGVKLVALDGRRVGFEASVRDADGEVLRGTHERFIVSVDKVRERLLKKKAAGEGRASGGASPS